MRAEFRGDRERRHALWREPATARRSTSTATTADSRNYFPAALGRIGTITPQSLFSRKQFGANLGGALVETDRSSGSYEPPPRTGRRLQLRDADDAQRAASPIRSRRTCCSSSRPPAASPARGRSARRWRGQDRPYTNRLAPTCGRATTTYRDPAGFAARSTRRDKRSPASRPARRPPSDRDQRDAFSTRRW